MLYWSIIKFGFARLLAYPTEILAVVLKFLIRIFALAIFWYLILQNSTRDLEVNNLISYFLISTAIGEFTMSQSTHLGKIIRRAVKDGNISQVMIKPVGLIQYYYAYVFGQQGARNLIVLVGFLAGVAMTPPAASINYLHFAALFLTSLAIGLTLNIFEGALSFIFTEVSGVKNAILHITRLLSGLWIPISLFPEHIRSLVELTPFPTLVFGPIAALDFPYPEFNFYKYLAVGAFWSLLLCTLVILFWRQAIKKYEVAGL